MLITMPMTEHYNYEVSKSVIKRGRKYFRGKKLRIIFYPGEETLRDTDNFSISTSLAECTAVLKHNKVEFTNNVALVATDDEVEGSLSLVRFDELWVCKINDSYEITLPN